MVKDLDAGQLTTIGPRALRTASSLPSLENYHSRYRMLKQPSIHGVAINLFTKRGTAKREPGRGRCRTCALVDIGAGHPSAREARVACACEGAVGVCARRVGVAVVGPICDRGARLVTFSVAPQCVRANEHSGSTAVCLAGSESGSIERGSSQCSSDRVCGVICCRTRWKIVPQLICPPNIECQKVNPGKSRGGHVHSSMLAQETPLPE